MEVAEGIHRVETLFAGRVNAVHLLIGPRATMLVDTATRDTAGGIIDHLDVHDPRSGSVVIGDAVLGEAVPLSGGEPAFPPTYRHVDAYLASIGLLRRLAPRALLPAHYPVYRDAAAQEFLAGSRRYAERVDRA